MSEHIKRWLKETRGDRCEECKWDTLHPVLGYVQLNVDHVNGNASRTIPENLRLLCLRCHGMTPTYGGLNRGKGRKSRYNKRPADVVLVVKHCFGKAETEGSSPSIQLTRSNYAFQGSGAEPRFRNR